MKPLPQDEPATAEAAGQTWEAMSVHGITELLCADRDAIAFYELVSKWSHTYDDLIDRDKPVSDEQVHKFVWMMLFDLPQNPFFARHHLTLRPLLMTGILNWVAANDMERSGDTEQLRIAHVIRYAVGDVLLAAMTITGGIEHARRHSARARLMLQDETWAHYRDEKKGHPCRR